jgi:hypothetical protein
MRVPRFSPLLGLVTALVAAAGSATSTQQAPAAPQGVLLEPIGQTGEAIFPAFEGWGPTKDGGRVLLLGYFNRNKSQEVDIPIGPDNFAIPIPKDFGDKRLTWTVRAFGQTSTVSFWANPPYWIDFYQNLANGNEPPRLKLSPTGPEFMGPPVQRNVQTLSATVGQPLTLTAWAADKPPTVKPETTPPGGGGARRPQSPPTDDEPLPAIIGGRVLPGGLSAGPPGGGAAAARAERRGDFRILWRKYRGPGEVTIADDVLPLENGGDASKFVEAKTTATFSAPGEYWLRAVVNDSSGDGGGGDQCCWTTAHIVVNVK